MLIPVMKIWKVDSEINTCEIDRLKKGAVGKTLMKI